MSSSNRLYANVLLAVALAVFLYSCSGNNNTGYQAGNTNSGTGITALKKGKKIDKENSLTKPLALYENNIPGKVKYISYKKYTLRAWHGTVVKRSVVVKGYYSYDTSGLLLCHNEYNADGTQRINCVYNYDDKNRPIEWDITDNGIARDSKIVFSYDKKGKKTEEIIDDKDPRFSTKAKFKYDGNGNETVEYDYAEGDKLKGIITSKYDAKGNQVELAYRSFDRAILKRITCTYDDSGNEIAGKKYDSDTELITKWVCRNNEKGRCVEKTYYAPYGGISLRNTYKYDGRDNLAELNYYNADGSLNEEYTYSYEYIYDKTGNIIKQTKFITRSGRKIPVELTESEVEYF